MEKLDSGFASELCYILIISIFNLLYAFYKTNNIKIKPSTKFKTYFQI